MPTTPVHLVPWLAPVVIALVAGCGAQLSKGEGRFEGGRFNFDWPDRAQVSSSDRSAFEDDVERSVDLLAVRLADTAIREALVASNEQTLDLTLEDMLERDHRWQNSEPGDPFVASLINEPCSEVVMRFRRNYPQYVEIFVTNRSGLNVCQTNKTTDYYQADEGWWQATYKRTDTAPRLGALEYDQSAGVYAVPAYLPIRDPASGLTIGVAKAVIKQANGE